MPPYDGIEEDLMSFLLRLDIRCQDEGWAPATYISVNKHQYNLTVQFTNVKEANIVANVECWWLSPSGTQDKHIIGHDTCNSCLLAKYRLASISMDLAMTLINRILDTYHNDGTYILWVLSNNIYHNNITFVESVREKIVAATLVQHNHDMEKYLLIIKNYLCMITPKTSSLKQYKRLITYILCQLKLTKNSIFLRYIQDIHISYQEGKLQKYTSMNLIQDAEDKIRVLKHASAWDPGNSQETPAMALTATPTLTKQLRGFLANQIMTKIKCLSQHGKPPW